MAGIGRTADAASHPVGARRCLARRAVGAATPVATPIPSAIAHATVDIRPHRQFWPCEPAGQVAPDPYNVGCVLPLACRSHQAHARGLAIGLKNDAEQAAELVGDFDWILVESCLAEGWCGLTAPFRRAGKPVFAIEYVERGMTEARVCREAPRFGLSAQLKRRELDAWSRPCWRVRAQTIGR